MKTHHNKQAKELQAFILKRFVFNFLVYCIFAITLYIVFDSFVSPAIGNIIAESTSHWEYISAEKVDSLWDEHRMVQFDTTTVSVEDKPSYIRYRALDTYAVLKSIKDDTLPVLFVLGIAGLIFYSLNKFVGYFNELSGSVAALFKNKSAPIILSKELKVVQNELQSIQEESLKNEQTAKEAERRKSELIAYIAHDLRTPLTSILGYSNLLKNSDTEESKRESYLKVINVQAQKMSMMLDDFFDITRLNMSDFKLDKQNLDLRTLCLQISDEFYPSALEKELSFEIDVPLNFKCYADPKYLTRALSNVIRNAITFATPGTTITICGIVQVEKDQNSDEPVERIPLAISSTSKNAVKNPNKQIILTVVNEGKEISAEALPHVFDTFYREDSARNASQGNAGLGLAITKNIIIAHGGSITARSEQSITEFIIKLPNNVTLPR